MSADIRRAMRVAAVLLTAASLGGCAIYDDIFSDFKKQPRIEPWEAEYRGDSLGFPGNPQMSVPITGSVAPGYMVSYSPTLGALDTLSRIQNPVPPSAESLERGRRYYQINCAVCHGNTGAGAGPVMQYGLPVPPVVSPIAQGYTDGYLFGIMRNGRGLMPNYRRIPEEHRWDVVNYVRALQGVVAVTVSTEPAGVPGEGGAAVPGASVLAPTRPVPHFQQPRMQADTTSPAPAGTTTGGAATTGVQR